MFVFDHHTFALAQELWQNEVPSRNAAYERFKDQDFRNVAKRIRYLKHLAKDLDSQSYSASLSDEDSRLCIRYEIDKGLREAYLNRYDWALVQDDPRFERLAQTAQKLRPLKI